MPATFIHRLTLTLGLLSLFHAAYSAAQHRSYLRLNELEFIHLPYDVIIQALASLFVVMYGVMFVAGDFKEIKASADLEKKSWETFSNVPSFYMFNHRGKAFSHNYVPSNTKSNLDQVN